RRGPREGLESLEDRRRTVPIGDGPLALSSLLGRGRTRRWLWQRSPVVQHGKALAPLAEYPVGRHGVCRQLSPHAKAGRADPILIEGWELEEVGGGHGIVLASLQLGARNSLHEHRCTLDVQQQ